MANCGGSLRIEMAELVLARIAASMREEWQGTHLVRLPQGH